MRISFARAKRQLELSVRQLVSLNTANKQGASRRDTLEAERKRDVKRGKSKADIAKRFKELDPVELEVGTEYLMAMFDAFNDTREHGMAGPLGVSYREIKAYCELMDETLNPWEVETLKAMDKAYLEESYKLSMKGK